MVSNKKWENLTMKNLLLNSILRKKDTELYQKEEEVVRGSGGALPRAI